LPDEDKIALLLEPDISYDVLIQVMDTARYYPGEAPPRDMFPQVSIGDAPAVLLKNHGVFTIGPTAEAALKTAVMVEDVARTAWLALQIGRPEVIPDDYVAKLHHRYKHVYGQR